MSSFLVDIRSILPEEVYFKFGKKWTSFGIEYLLSENVRGSILREIPSIMRTSLLPSVGSGTEEMINFSRILPRMDSSIASG